MCGIGGIVGPHDSGWATDAVGRLIAAQRHRGPDDSGLWRGSGVVLGHLRLSIVDLTEAGHQPMSIDGGRLTIVFNGEVFNYIELRRELESLGHVFVGRSDTEVVLRAFDQWGQHCCTRFNGMWAFAIWDERQQRLFCSRDRFGVKPFHYAVSGGNFLFASEIKGLIACQPELAAVDHGYVARFLRTSLCNDTEQTFFSNVKSLLPAHSMWVRLSGNEGSIESVERYWAFDREHALATYDYSSAKDTLLSLLEDSVRLRLRADVPVGTCLSGGLDSSSIVALASRQLDGQPVWTFSSLYSSAGYDESRFVRQVNEAFPTVPHEVWPEPGRLLDIMPRIAWHQDEPTAAPGVYSQWHVMESAATGVRVLLDGQGADELLGGYSPYYVDYVRSLARDVAVRPAPNALRKLTAGWAEAQRKLHGRLPRELALSFMTEDMKRLMRPLRGSKRSEVESDYLSQWQETDDVWAVRGPFSDRLSNRLYDALLVKSIPALLRYEDRSSMAFSIEARTPFLDYRLVEFGLALPYDERIDGEWTKKALRLAMDGILPDEVTWRRDKLGYPTPLAEWLRSSFKADAEEIIFSEEFKNRGVFDAAVVRDRWRDHLAGEADYSWNVWRWLSLEFWFREFVD